MVERLIHFKGLHNLDSLDVFILFVSMSSVYFINELQGALPQNSLKLLSFDSWISYEMSALLLITKRAE